jgi:hypothetical protein
MFRVFIPISLVGPVAKSRICFYAETNCLTRVEDNTDPENTFTIDYVYDKHQYDILIRTVYIDLMGYAVAFGGSESSSFN